MVPVGAPSVPMVVTAVAKPTLCSFRNQQPPVHLHQFPEYLHPMQRRKKLPPSMTLVTKALTTLMRATLAIFPQGLMWVLGKVHDLGREGSEPPKLESTHFIFGVKRNMPSSFQLQVLSQLRSPLSKPVLRQHFVHKDGNNVLQLLVKNWKEHLSNISGMVK